MVTISKSDFRSIKSRIIAVTDRVKSIPEEVIESKEFAKPGIFSSLQAKMLVTYLVIFALIMVLLNIYPATLSRNLVFDSKESSMKTQANLICTSIGGLDTFSRENVREIIEELEMDGNSISGIVVTSADGSVVFEKSEYTDEDIAEPKIINFGIGRAMEGSDVFYSSFKNGVFCSCTSIPITEEENIIGIVHLYEFDKNQGQMILHFQENFRRLTVILAVVVILLSIIFSNTITKRLRMILEAIQYVREGEYSYRVVVGGKDEVSLLGNEFNSLTDRLQSTEEMRRRFVSDASHELKTPLASIRLLSDSIVQNSEMDVETVKEFVEDIGNEAERLARTTEKLLNLTRLDNKIVFVKQEVDVKQVAKSTIRMLEPIADNYEVTLNSSLDDGCIIYATDDDVYQVIMNLVENAIKYNYPGGNVDIDLSRQNNEVVLIISDTGIGIPEADLPSIFDRFYRVDKARSRASGGSGLGLSIVKSIIEEHGGSITARRREHGGTVFEVHFSFYEPQKEYTDK